MVNGIIFEGKYFKSAQLSSPVCQQVAAPLILNEDFNTNSLSVFVSLDLVLTINKYG